MTDEFSAKDFGASFKGFMEQMARQSPEEETPFAAKLRSLFGANPTDYPVVSESLGTSDLPNVQRALGRALAQPGVTHELFGVLGGGPFDRLSISGLLKAGGGFTGGGAPQIGPVRYLNMKVGADDAEVIPCAENGLYLVINGDVRVAVLLTASLEMMFQQYVRIEVMAAQREIADGFLRELREALRRDNIYRGKILSLDRDRDGSMKVRVHPARKIRREDIILPVGVLDRIERQTVVFARNAEELKRRKRHLKRGLLLHGPPGTGKTLTAMYLAALMPERTVFVMTGQGLGALEETCRLARRLEPATVVLEDVDLIAEDRNRTEGCRPLLFDLLNQMDGIADDADLLFLLTTNQPQKLEAALAARPGRIDMAIEVPIPDADCRLRLFELYGDGISLRADLARFVARTDGVSAAFIRELLRRATLFSAAAGKPEVGDEEMEAALHELTVTGGPLTRSLLGGAPSPG